MKQLVVKFLYLISTIGLAACNQQPPSSLPVLQIHSESSLMSRPQPGISAVRADLTRYRGQTSFLTTPDFVLRAESATTDPSARSKTESGIRAEQESDVFKVGKPGSKLLYLLNNYRGLQIVSYEKGTEAPLLLGRAEPTGNYPSDMYLDPKQDRLFVLERIWFNSENNNYTPNQSRILVYDVSKPEAPTLVDKVNVKGEIADSRIVGQVLYVVSTLRPDNRYINYNNSDANPKGIVTSYDLSGNRVAFIQELNLTLPAVYGTNLRVITIAEKNSYKYYLVAHLSQSGWGWWDRQGMVQVVDISDEHGKISSVMSVSVKGSIQRPHQMQIKNNTLITVSNYQVPSATAENPSRQIARIAVETFKFPQADSEIVSEEEAQLRRLYIDKQVNLETEKGVDKNVARQKWMNDKTWGMQERFVKTEGQLRKLTPDSLVTTGDSTGLSAQLQDVRIQGNLLYAFWVPANQVDPLDVFDISQPQTGVHFLKRLTFDGWISRSEPLFFEGRNYVIGLGWVVPAENNEMNKRYAQVKVFEVVATAKDTQATEVATLVLNKSQFWANFNGQDKFIEFKPTGDGQGEILFEGTRYSSDLYQTGGQLISYDLSQLAGGNNIIKEGAFLMGESSWLRRVFTNTEIDRINSFSDASLVTYDKIDKGTSSATVKAAHILELARNIRGYVAVKSNGIQIIGERNYWGSVKKEQTFLRVVSKKNVDAEKTQVTQEIEIEGTYVQHLYNPADAAIVLLTSQSRYVANSYSVSYQMHRVHLGTKNQLVIKSSATWPQKSEVAGQGKMLRLPSGEVLVMSGTELRLTPLNTMDTKSIGFEKCQVDKETQVEIKVLNGKVYLIRKKPVDLKTEFKSYARAYRNELVALEIDKSTAKVKCSKGINIPGDVLTFDGQKMIVADSWVDDIYGAKVDILNISAALTSLKITADGTKAELIDMIDNVSEAMDYIPTSLGLVRYAGKSNERSVAALEFVKQDSQAFLARELNHTPELDLNYGSLVKVIESKNNSGSVVGVIKSWRQMQAVRWSAKERPRVLRLAAVDLKNRRQEFTNMVSVFESDSSSDAIHYTADQKSLEVSSGLYGIKQFFLE